MMLKLLMITLTLLISSCQFGNISLPETGIQDLYTIFIDEEDGAHCFVAEYDFDTGERVSDFVKTSLINCSKIHGVKHDVFYGTIEPNIRELSEICADSEYCN